jgi:NAD(P)-dependent dehydrogenase (short-subunit alcohol dehydrogenase family)
LAGEGQALRGRTVVITGAAGGIGAALARRFAREESRLALLDCDPAGVEALARELESAGAFALPLACDVTSLADCESAMKSVVSATGGIDVLVNNAGITHLGGFQDVEVDVLRRVMEVNFFGSVHCTKAALPALLAPASRRSRRARATRPASTPCTASSIRCVPSITATVCG